MNKATPKSPSQIAFGMLAGAAIGGTAGLVASTGPGFERRFSDAILGAFSGLVTGALVGHASTTVP